MLGRLAELSLAACEDLAARAAQAEEPQLAADLHTAFSKAGRCLRQTVMLEARLAATAVRPNVPIIPAATGWTPRPRAPRQWIDREKLAEQMEGLDLERLDDLDDDFDPDAEPATSPYTSAAAVPEPVHQPNPEPASPSEPAPLEPAPHNSWEWLDRLDGHLPPQARAQDPWRGSG